MLPELRLDLREVGYLDRALGDVRSHQAYARPLSGLTIGALGELVCWGSQWAGQKRHAEVSVLRRWAQQHRPLSRAQSALDGAGDPAPMAAGSARFEVRPVPTKREMTELPWQQFLERFKTRLTEHGFPSKLALGLSGALGEMVDNVIEHSGEAGAPPAAGIVAFHVEPQWMAYAVADVGRGVLASLRTDPRWAGISTAREALQRAVRDGATRRQGEQRGSGYQTVIHALAERNGYLNFRSGDGRLELRGSATTLQEGGGPVAALSGLQLVVHCCLDGQSPGERWLPAQI